MNKNFLRLALCLLFVLMFAPALLRAENPIQKSTYTYSIKGNDTLRLDRYDIPDAAVRPCVIFVFGGGFYTGSRDLEFYIPYYHFLVNEGYTVFAIDYRLGLKNIQKDKGLKARDFLNLFQNAIYMAVEDLFDATSFIVERADEWKIDRNMVITSGSSAGAITVLQGEYERCNGTELAVRHLPPDFRYAGVIGCAGAIYSNQGNLKWKTTPAPIQMFHGDADMNVPFDKLKMCKYGFFGSEYIAEKYKKNKFPYYFYAEENMDHKLASTPLIDNHEEMLVFLNRYVKEKQPLQTNVLVNPLNMPDVKKNFKLKDYVKKNFGL